MWVWLDDERPMPDNYDRHVKTAQEAIALLKTGEVDCISLDHDLGDFAGTGYDVAKWIEEAAFNGTLAKVHCHVHSMNPVGKQAIKAALRNAYRYWMDKKSQA